MGRVYGQGANPAHFPHPLKQEKKGTGPPFPSCSSFLALLSFRWEQEKRREREGERIDTNDYIFNGKSQEKNRREMNREEGETKQDAEKMALFFIYPLSLISLSLISPFEIRKTKGRTMRRRWVRKGTEEIGRGEDMMKYGKIHAQGVIPCLPFHCFITRVPFLCFISEKETEGEKGKGSERGENTRMPFFWKRAARNRRDRKQGDSDKIRREALYIISPLSFPLPFELGKKLF